MLKKCGHCIIMLQLCQKQLLDQILYKSLNFQLALFCCFTRSGVKRLEELPISLSMFKSFKSINYVDISVYLTGSVNMKSEFQFLKKITTKMSREGNRIGFNGRDTPIYTSGQREALREQSILPINTTQCPRSGARTRTTRFRV